MSKRTQLMLISLALSLILVCVLLTQSNTDSDMPEVDTTSVSTEASETNTERSPEAIVADYNALVIEYNDAVTIYNESVDVVITANEAFNSDISNAQALLDAGSIPYEMHTKVALEQAVQNAKDAIVPAPSLLSPRDVIEIPQNATDDEIDGYIDMALTGIEDLTQMEVPAPLDAPDYTTVSEAIQVAAEAFNHSVLVQLQITAPSDAFVLLRVKEIDSVLSAAAVTKANDPNELLGTEGGYIGCIYFSDINVDKTQLGLKPSEYDVISMGTVGGGAVEIYKTIEDAEARDAYLAQYDGTSLNPGSHIVLGTMVIRTSSKLPENLQKELTDLIIAVLIRVD